MRRYGHGHSIAVGLLLALAMERHLLLGAVLVFAAGLVTGRAWSFWTDVARAVKAKLLGAKREPIVTGLQALYDNEGSRSRGRDRIPF